MNRRTRAAPGKTRRMPLPGLEGNLIFVIMRDDGRRAVAATGLPLQIAGSIVGARRRRALLLTAAAIAMLVPALRAALIDPMVTLGYEQEQREPSMILASVIAGLAIVAAPVPVDQRRVTPVPETLRAEFGLAPFYKKFVSAGGVPIVASDKVSDFALLEALFLVEQMLGQRQDVLSAIAKNQVRLAIMAPDEYTTDIPEHADLAPKDFWDWRARGLGATDIRPAVSCGEENLLGFSGDPYSTENLLVHEFGHVIHERGMSGIDPTFDGRLLAAFDAAQRDGLWRDKYAATNRMEYWAEGVQSWFDTNRENDSEHNAVNTRAELKEYDPRLAVLLAEVFGDGAWRYTPSAKRVPPSPHLAGFDVRKAPRFTWPEHLLAARERYLDGNESPAPADTVSLAPLAENAQSDWGSPDGGEPTTVYFQNASAETIRLDWIDFEGRAKHYYTLRRGEHAVSSTFAGHVWRATAASGAVLGYFIAGEVPARAVVKGVPQASPGN